MTDTPEKLVAAGWRFTFSAGTRFVACKHDSGGAFSVCEVVTPVHRGEDFRDAIGESIAAHLNGETQKDNQ